MPPTWAGAEDQGTEPIARGCLRFLMRVFGTMLHLLLLLGSTSYALARERQLRRAPPPVDLVVHGGESRWAKAKVRSLQTKTLLAASSAEAAAAEAGTAPLRIEALRVQTTAVRPEIALSESIAETAAKSATKASSDATNALKATEANAKSVVDDAKRLAVFEVQKMLRSKYHELKEWREKVLTDPFTRRKKAAARAAEPYFKMVGKFKDQIVAYNAGIGSMTSRAENAEAAADSMKASAEAKDKSGDKIGAAQDHEMAKALKAESESLKGQASTMTDTVDNMEKTVIPQYVTAANLAAWNAEYREDPDSLPPPPVNPNFAFAPPPPSSQ